MNRVIVLDSGPLGMIAHSRPKPEVEDWVRRLLADGDRLVIPAIADYEVRRELLRARRLQSVACLDGLKITLAYWPLTTDALMNAAQLWATVRQQGAPTAHPHALDGDVILAAQANILAERVRPHGLLLLVATLNMTHLQQLTNAQLWNTI